MGLTRGESALSIGLSGLGYVIPGAVGKSIDVARETPAWQRVFTQGEGVHQSTFDPGRVTTTKKSVPQLKEVLAESPGGRLSPDEIPFAVREYENYLLREGVNPSDFPQGQEVIAQIKDGWNFGGFFRDREAAQKQATGRFARIEGAETGVWFDFRPSPHTELYPGYGAHGSPFVSSVVEAGYPSPLKNPLDPTSARKPGTEAWHYLDVQGGLPQYLGKPARPIPGLTGQPGFQHIPIERLRDPAKFYTPADPVTKQRLTPLVELTESALPNQPFGDVAFTQPFGRRKTSYFYGDIDDIDISTPGERVLASITSKSGFIPGVNRKVGMDVFPASVFSDAQRIAMRKQELDSLTAFEALQAARRQRAYERIRSGQPLREGVSRESLRQAMSDIEAQRAFASDLPPSARQYVRQRDLAELRRASAEGWLPDYLGDDYRRVLDADMGGRLYERSFWRGGDYGWGSDDLERLDRSDVDLEQRADADVDAMRRSDSDAGGRKDTGDGRRADLDEGDGRRAALGETGRSVPVGGRLRANVPEGGYLGNSPGLRGRDANDSRRNIPNKGFTPLTSPDDVQRRPPGGGDDVLHRIPPVGASEQTRITTSTKSDIPPLAPPGDLRYDTPARIADPPGRPSSLEGRGSFPGRTPIPPTSSPGTTQRKPRPRIPDSDLGPGFQVELKAKPGQEGTAPQQVEWVAFNRNVLDLETGEHHIEPLSQEHLKSLKVTRRGQSATDRKISAGALNIEAKGESLVAEVKPRTRKIQIQPDEDGGIMFSKRQRRAGGRRRRKDEEDRPTEINLVIGRQP